MVHERQFAWPKSTKHKKARFIKAAEARGWHFADACPDPTNPDPKKFQEMLEGTLQYAKDTAKDHNEDFNKAKAKAAFHDAFNNHPRIPTT